MLAGQLLMLAKFGSQADAEDQFRLLKDFVCKIYLEVPPPQRTPKIIITHSKM